MSSWNASESREGARFSKLAFFLMERENVERLCKRIEELAREREAEAETHAKKDAAA